MPLIHTRRRYLRSGGAEEENDEDYYERIHAEFQDSQFYVANDADYIKWAKEVPGIGDCIVEPAVLLWHGISYLY